MLFSLNRGCGVFFLNVLDGLHISGIQRIQFPEFREFTFCIERIHFLHSEISLFAFREFIFCTQRTPFLVSSEFRFGVSRPEFLVSKDTLHGPNHQMLCLGMGEICLEGNQSLAQSSDAMHEYGRNLPGRKPGMGRIISCYA